MPDETLHATHPDVVKRLRRAEGHLRSIIGMIESGRSCLDLAQQLHAVEKAIATVKRTLVHDHIDHCLEAVTGLATPEQRTQVGKFKAITKYL